MSYMTIAVDRDQIREQDTVSLATLGLPCGNLWFVALTPMSGDDERQGLRCDKRHQADRIRDALVAGTYDVGSACSITLPPSVVTEAFRLVLTPAYSHRRTDGRACSLARCSGPSRR